MTRRKISDYLGNNEESTKYDGTLFADIEITDITDPNGAATPDYITITRGGFTFSTQGFDGSNTTEYKTYKVELSHWADLTKPLEVHFRGTPTNDSSGDVKMVIEYFLQKKNANGITGTSKSAKKTIVANGNTNATEYYFSFVLSTADVGLSTMENGDSLLINIKRIPSDSEDTYSADFALIEFGVHAAVNKNGTLL